MTHPRLPSLGPVRVAAVALLSLAAACSDGTGPDGGGTREFELSLGPGQSRALGAEGDLLRIRIPASEEGAEYRLAVQSAARTEGATSMRVRVLAGEDARGASPSRLPKVHLSTADGRRAGVAASRAVLSDDAELRLRENARRELRRRGARPVGRARRGADPGARAARAALRPAGVPARLQTLEFHYPVSEDLSVTCDTSEAGSITGVVRAVGQRVALVEDKETPGVLSGDDYETLADEFDRYVFATDSAYFGGPEDIDGNERVLVLLTPEVNKLTPSGATTRIGGFFVPTDLADAGDEAGGGTAVDGTCPASNEGEVLYLLAPDPRGDFGKTASRATTLENARAVASHEFQHLLNAEQRLIVGDGTFDDLEDSWLSEGLSHVAEEVVGLRRADHAVRRNLGLNEILDSEVALDAFNTFHLDNFSRLQEFLEDTEGTRALAVDDPSGERSLEMRGFGWLFLRWLGDRFGPAGSGIVAGSREEELFRELASGGPGHLTGIENVERATGRSWEELMADFSIMPAVDDAVDVEDPDLELATWNLREVFRELHLNDGTSSQFPEGYPLSLQVAEFASADYVFEVRSSTARHFVFANFSSPGPTPELIVELTDNAGNPLPSSAAAQITVVRAR